MGRRSINTTKSGKYMNPTDQARKEARKKELKKNKKQRQMVRAAVLKGKDPGQILEEMEKIDEMEYNVYQPSPLNEKVLREKRKKLKETFDRVMRLYHNDDPELWSELKRKEVEYEKKRLKKQQYYESVKHAQTVQIDEIPLPQINVSTAPFPPTSKAPPAVPLQPPPHSATVSSTTSKKSIQSKVDSNENVKETKNKESPGCPPGPPPNLFDMKELDSDQEDSFEYLKSKKNINEQKDKDYHSESDNESESDKSNNDIEEFMNEVNYKSSNKKKSNDSKNNKDVDTFDDSNKDDKTDKTDTQIQNAERSSIRLPSIAPTHTIILPSGPPPPPMGLPSAMLFRPPPLRPNMSGLPMRMQPGHLSGRPNMMPCPPNLPPRLGIRMPPGPPPGLPPSRLGQHKLPNQHSLHPKDQKGVTTITAKPQIRNLSADVTRFVPSTLRVKREDKAKVKPKQFSHQMEFSKQQKESSEGVAKDDAYMQFMREMQSLL